MTNTEPLDLDAIEEHLGRASAASQLGGSPGLWGQLRALTAVAASVPALIAEVRRLRGLTIGDDDDPNVDTCWAVVLDDCGSADLYETREEADAARAKAPDTGLDYIVTTTIVPATPEETR